MNIGRYEIIQELGRGGMAIVYLARDPRVNRQVAIKVLPQQFTFDPQFRGRFQREAEVVARLEHDGIVPVYDSGEHEGQPFIVMRYMPGGSLAGRLARGPLGLEAISKIFARLGAGIDHAHSQGIIHRDIKPANILFDAQGNAALSDFGIAKISEGTSAFTATGGIVGTPAYMAPEQVQGNRALDGRCDVYTLGVVLFEALTGETPYHADTPMGVAVAHLNQPVPSVHARLASVPPAFDPVIRRALDKEPARRFQTAGELSRAVDAAAAGKGTVLEAPGTYVEPAGSAPAGATYLEPGAGRPATQAPQTFNPPSLPVKRKPAVPVWLVGGAVLAVCACVGVFAALAFEVFPNPFAAAPSPTLPVAIVEESTATATLEVAPTDAPSPTIEFTPFVPEGLANTYIEYILDASGSMLQAMDGTTRLAVAQDVLTTRLNNLPDGTQVGLRVYGHRIPYAGRENESCADIELAVPITAAGPDAIIAWLPGMQALGMTPMSESIRQAANDFTFDGTRRNFIVLISDGEETCGDDPASVVELLREIGIDFSIHVIGLDVDPGTAAQLSSIADAGGGVYYDARSRADLDAAVGQVNDGILLASDAPPPSPTAVPSPTPVPQPNAVITKEGTVSASSTYSLEYTPSLARDGNPATSWFSAGPGTNGLSTFTWTGVQDDFIGAIEIVSNRSHAVQAFRTGYGFGEVTVQVLDAAGNVVFEQSVNLDGTPDPDVLVTPNVMGRTVVLTFSGSEAPDCGGFAELVISAVR